VNRPNGAKNYYVKLAEHVDEGRVDRLRALMGPQPKETRKQRSARKKFWENVSLEAAPRRHYPLGALLRNCSASRPIPVWAPMEWKRLGRKRWEEPTASAKPLMDAQGRAVPGTVRNWKEPVDGNPSKPRLTRKIQAAADSTLAEMVESIIQLCVAVVMKPDTGEIVAISTAPHSTRTIARRTSPR
jgi:cell division protein FtsI/penicillin-binding protein 2